MLPQKIDQTKNWLPQKKMLPQKKIRKNGYPKNVGVLYCEGVYYCILEKWRTLLRTGLLMRFKHYIYTYYIYIYVINIYIYLYYVYIYIYIYIWGFRKIRKKQSRLMISPKQSRRSSCGGFLRGPRVNMLVDLPVGISIWWFCEPWGNPLK